MKALLDAGADPNSCDPNGFTPLHACAVRDNVDTARILLVQGADIQARDTSLNTPLHVACTWGSRGIVDLLLDAGADINAAAHNGFTPLHAAQMWATDGNLACHLLDRGANPAPSAPCVFGSPLHMAVQGESENLVKRLLNAGVPVNAADPDGRPPSEALPWSACCWSTVQTSISATTRARARPMLFARDAAARCRSCAPSGRSSCASC